MPESVHDNESELRNIPEHTAQKAATANPQPAHSDTPGTARPEQDPANHDLKEATTLHHGHAASVAAEKARE